jgi:putative peptidoglycan lipid II flippase
LVAQGNLDEFRKTLARSIRLAVFLSLPAACGLAVLAKPIIAVLYQHGRFTPYATEQTAYCLQAFAVGLAGYAALKVLAPTFYAFGDSRTPALVSLFSIGVNALLCYVLAWKLELGVRGLALSTAIVALTNFIQLLWHMRRRLEHIEGGVLLRSAGKVAVASAFMSGAAWGVQQWLDFNRYLNLAGSLLVGVIVFGAVCQLLRVQEFGEFLAVLRFGRKQARNTT